MHSKDHAFVHLRLSNTLYMVENTIDCELNKMLDQHILMDVQSDPSCMYSDLSIMTLEIDKNIFSNIAADSQDNTEMSIKVEEVIPFQIPLQINFRDNTLESISENRPLLNFLLISPEASIETQGNILIDCRIREGIDHPLMRFSAPEKITVETSTL